MILKLLKKIVDFVRIEDEDEALVVGLTGCAEGLDDLDAAVEILRKDRERLKKRKSRICDPPL